MELITLEWISVKDKYPENNEQEVIVCLSTGEIRIAYYSRFVPLGHLNPNHIFEGNLTHIDGSEYTAELFTNVDFWSELPKKV